MIFIGDIACPNEKAKDFSSSVEKIIQFQNEIIVANFEAVIKQHTTVSRNNTLYNSKDGLCGFHNAKKVILSLANNHMYDYPEDILYTKELLIKQGYGAFGLYNNDGSFSPYEYTDENNKSYAFFGHCWSLYTRTNRNTINNIRVVDCGYDEFINVVSQYKRNHSTTQVFCMMHWNFDMETIPLPFHRLISRKLIDVGVEAVIGSHSHVPQCVELYNDHIIAYGLGNFYLPSGIFFDGKLCYPGYSKTTIGISISDSDTQIMKFSTDCNYPIEFISSENTDSASEVVLLPSELTGGVRTKPKAMCFFTSKIEENQRWYQLLLNIQALNII